MKKIIALQNRLDDFVSGKLTLDRDEVKTFLWELDDPDLALDSLYRQQALKPGLLTYAFDDTVMGTFHKNRSSRYRMRIQDVSARIAACEEEQDKPPNVVVKGCNLCAAFRRKWTGKTERRVMISYLDKQTNLVLGPKDGTISRHEKLTGFVNNKPYLRNHIVIATRDRIHSEHSDWVVDVQDIAVLASQLTRYAVGQNSSLGASSPMHKHYHAFSFDGPLPIESADREPITERTLGSHQVAVDRCDFPVPTYRIHISNTRSGIDPQATRFLSAVREYYTNLHPDYLISAVGRRNGDGVDMYFSLKNMDSKASEQIWKTYGIGMGFANSAGIIQLKSGAEVPRWTAADDAAFDSVFSQISPTESDCQRFEIYMRVFMGDPQRSFSAIDHAVQFIERVKQVIRRPKPAE